MVSSMSFLKYSLWPSVLTPSGSERPSVSPVLGSSFTSSVETPSRLALRRRSNKSEIVATKVRAPAASPAVLPKVARPNLVLRRPELSRTFPRALRGSSTASLFLVLLRANDPHILFSTSFTSFDTLYSLDDYRPGVVTPAVSPGWSGPPESSNIPSRFVLLLYSPLPAAQTDRGKLARYVPKSQRRELNTPEYIELPADRTVVLQAPEHLLQKELHYDDRNGKKGRHSVGDPAHQQAPPGPINMTGIL